MRSSIKIRLPLLHVIKNYQFAWLRPDVFAGITVAGLAIPQAMAYAGIAGVQLTAGLYAAIAAMVAYALFSTSRFVIAGPDAAMAALAGATVIPLAGANTQTATLLIAVLALLVGVACLIGVYARLGFVAEFLSRPIMLGYMAGLAIAIIASQAPRLFGLVDEPGNSFFGSLYHLLTNLSAAHVPTLVFSILLILITLTLRNISKTMPVALLLLVGSIAASALFNFAELGIATVGSVPVTLPIPELPLINYGDIQNLIVPALAIAMIAYANTVSLTRTYARKKNEQITPDQEFAGLGASNIASGIFGGMPVSASAARSAVNVSSNPKTQIAQLFGAVAIAVVLVLFSSILQYLPYAALAVIVIIAVLPLFDLKEFRSIWHAWRSEALLALATIFGVALLGILQGLLLAVLLAMLNWVRKSAFPNDAILGVAADGAVRDMSRPPKTHAVPGMIIYRFDAPLFFGNANYFKDRVNGLIKDSPQPIRWFLWDAETITTIDSTGGQILLTVIRDLKKNGVTFAIARMKGPMRSVVHHSHRLSGTLRDTPHYTSLGQAIEAYYDEYPELRQQA